MITCAYHGGALRHSIKHCMALKHKVKSLIDESSLKFQEDNPNVRTNSLEIHGSSLISVLEDEDTWELKRRVEDVLTSKRFILKVLCKASMVDCEGNEEDRCPLHPKTLHDMEECLLFKELL